MDLNLQERRQNFLEKTLLEVENSVKEILKIRTKERNFELAFKFPQNNENFIKLSLNFAGGSIEKGKLSVIKQGQEQQSFDVLPFPFLFLHEISVICLSIEQQIKYVTSNIIRCSLSVIDSLITSANNALSILSDPKFIEIDISNYIDPPLPQEASIIISFNLGKGSLTASSLFGFPETTCDNKEDPTYLLAIWQILQNIVQSLRFLRSDVATWNLTDDDDNTSKNTNETS